MPANNPSILPSGAPAELKPLRVGQILDRSLSKFPQMFSVPLLAMMLIAASCQTLTAYVNFLSKSGQLSPGNSVLCSVIVAIVNYSVSITLYIFLMLTANSVWRELRLGAWDILGAITFRKSLRVLHAFIAVGFRAALYLLLLVIPGLLFIARSALTLPLVILEDVRPVPAIQRSRELMTYAPDASWYSPRHPYMRFFAIGIVTTILSMFPGILIGYAVYTNASNTTFGPIDFTLNIAIHTLSYITGLIGNLAIVGFYYDLRVRAEGLDMMSQLDAMASEAAPGSSMAAPTTSEHQPVR